MFSRQRTLVEAKEEYLAALVIAGRSKETLRTYGCILGRLTKRVGDRPVARITSADLHSYFLELVDFSLAYRSLVGRVTKGFFHWCAEQGLIRANPIETIHLPQPKVNAVRPFRQDEIKALLSKANLLETAILKLLLDTGLRGGELAALQWTDMDMEQGLIRVRQGKGGKSRVLALNEGPKQALLVYLQGGAHLDSLLWPRGFDRPALGRMLDRLARRAGVSCVHPHRFRHHWATMALGAGIDPLALKCLGGWSSLQMVERYVAFSESQRAVEVHRQHSLVA